MCPCEHSGSRRRNGFDLRGERQLLCSHLARKGILVMPEIISIGGLETAFPAKDETGGSLDVFEMTVQPNARMPIPDYHESWDETIYGLSGVTTWRVAGGDVAVGPGQSVFIKRGWFTGFATTPTSRHLPLHLEPRGAGSRLLPGGGRTPHRRRP